LAVIDPNEDPSRLENDDAQDIQASTFQYGRVKTQQQLIAENPHMNGDMYAEATLGEEEIDENQNGIPDDQETGVGTYLTASVEGIIATLEAADDDENTIESVFRPEDQDINDKRSKLHHAVEFVQQRAGSDPHAQELLDNYNRTTDQFTAALGNARNDHSAANFMALKIADLDRTISRSEIVIFEAETHGESKELADARKWHDSAQSMRDKLAEIQKLPADQQQAAFDKYVQENSRSRIAGEWKQFSAGNLSKWEKQDTHHLTADSPDYTEAWSRTRNGSGASFYDTPGTPSSSSSSWSLSSIFSDWALPWSSSQPASTANNQPASGNKSENSWSLTSLFSNLAFPWSSSSSSSAPDPQRQTTSTNNRPTINV
jgi:hypothetical protein